MKGKRFRERFRRHFSYSKASLLLQWIANTVLVKPKLDPTHHAFNNFFVNVGPNMGRSMPIF